jgi:formate dehydrogenase iron-sulfur subunit
MTVLPPPIEKQERARTLIDALLAEEREWTAVDRFSNWHDLRSKLPGDQSYRRLIPLAQPKPGQQYAFEVDLEKCSGCKACVAACHSLNGLDETETWRSVGLLVGPPSVQQHVTTACHHCVDPACLNGCPVLAYDKDPVTGIVRHLDDQCIGCQYCVMKCPYEVPQYSKRLGIVRKCDMCYHRLAVGEAPACVQACPSEAIRISIVDQASVSAAFRTAAPSASSPHTAHAPATCVHGQGSVDGKDVTVNKFLPDSPNPARTLPTTRFVSSNVSIPGLKAADHAALRLEQPHWPLLVMLLLSQSAAGLFVAAAFLGPANINSLPATSSAVALLAIGLVAATLHLGRPLKAWRAFLGWRTSWLSREVIALNAFAGAAVLAIGCRSLPAWREVLNICAAILGLVAVFASAMVYIDTGRRAWGAHITFGNFFGATLVLGAVLASVVLATTTESESAVPFLEAALAIRAVLFVWRRLQQRAALDNVNSPLHLNARVVRELLPWTATADAALFLVAILAGVLTLSTFGGIRLVWVALAALATFGAEVIARYIFFVASANKRMPGGVLA